MKWPFLRQQPEASPVAAEPAPLPAPIPAPINNRATCGAIWADRYGVRDFQPDPGEVVIVSNEANLEAATKMGQFAITFPSWHVEYDTLLAEYTRMWVAVTRKDYEWLCSVLSASWRIQERMGLCVCDTIEETLSLKLSMDLAARSPQQNISLDVFFQTNFQPMPKSDKQVRVLLAPKPVTVRSLLSAPPSLGGAYVPADGYVQPAGLRSTPRTSSGLAVDPNSEHHGKDGISFCY
jgi:hypothetical protein